MDCRRSLRESLNDGGEKGSKQHEKRTTPSDGMSRRRSRADEAALELRMKYIGEREIHKTAGHAVSHDSLFTATAEESLHLHVGRIKVKGQVSCRVAMRHP